MDLLSSFELDYESGLPIWIQVKNRIGYLIATGEYKEGDRLPTVRALASNLDISYNTVNRAYMDLEREGYITTRKGRGTFVSDKWADLTVDSMAEQLCDEMIRVAKSKGMGKDDIFALVSSRLAVLCKSCQDKH